MPHKEAWVGSATAAYLVLSSIVFGGTPLGATVVGAQSRAFLELLGTLVKVYDQVSDAAGWVLWGQAALQAIEQEKAPPPSPMSPSAFHRKLLDQRAAVSSLRIPSYETPLPPTTGPTGGSFDRHRAELRSRVAALQDATAELQESLAAIQYFEVLERSLEGQRVRLGRLAIVLDEVIRDLPWVPEVLLFTALDVTTEYIPTVAETKSVVSELRKKGRAAYDLRRGALRDRAAELLNLLAVEAVGLEAEAQRLRALDEAVRQLQRALADRVETRDAARRTVQRMETYVDAAERDLQQAQDELAGQVTALNNLRAEANSVRARYQEPYVCPVSGADWIKCIEISHQE